MAELFPKYMDSEAFPVVITDGPGSAELLKQRSVPFYGLLIKLPLIERIPEIERADQIEGHYNKSMPTLISLIYATIFVRFSKFLSLCLGLVAGSCF